MGFSHRQDVDKTIVEVDEARLDATLASSFQDYMFDLIGQGEKELVIDLSKVNFMDSSGLGAIVAARRKVDEQTQGNLLLAAPSKAVSDLFDLTCMDKIFSIHSSVAEALTAKGK